MIEWYLKVVRDNYANFSGRARRSEYWYFTLFNVIVAIALFVLTFLVPALIFVYYIYALAVFIPGIAAAVRRLHDIGKSGWFYLVILIPIIGGIWLIVLLATEGTTGPNEYGEDPKRPYDNDINEIGTTEVY
jgi:uncharacterized membrane protein YhaH (DUF805 family)